MWDLHGVKDIPVPPGCKTHCLAIDCPLSEEPKVPDPLHDLLIPGRVRVATDKVVYDVDVFT